MTFFSGDCQQTKKTRVFFCEKPFENTFQSSELAHIFKKQICRRTCECYVSFFLRFFSYFLCFVRGSFVAVDTSVASVREDEDPFANFIFSEIVLAD